VAPRFIRRSAKDLRSSIAFRSATLWPMKPGSSSTRPWLKVPKKRSMWGLRQGWNGGHS